MTYQYGGGGSFTTKIALRVGYWCAVNILSKLYIFMKGYVTKGYLFPSLLYFERLSSGTEQASVVAF